LTAGRGELKLGVNFHKEMSMRFIFILAMVMVFPVHAEIFKCDKGDGTLNYQSYPCGNSGNQKSVIKSNSKKHKSYEEDLFDRVMTGDEAASKEYIKHMESPVWKKICFPEHIARRAGKQAYCRCIRKSK